MAALQIRGWWRFAPRQVSRLALLACALALAGCNIKFGGDFVSVLDDERAVATAIGAIRSNYSGPVRVLKIVLADDGLLMQAQDPSNLRQIVEWRLLRQQSMFFTWDRVQGPSTADLGSTFRTRHDDRLFDLDEVDLSNWGKVADAAIARAALQDKGGIATIEIARPPVMVPGTTSGQIRWTFEVKSERETARVFANAKGEITGANLNGTLRMKNLTMYQRPELAAEAIAEVKEHAGDKPVFLRIYFTSASIGFETNVRDANHPIGGLRTNAAYSWSYNGLQRVMGSVDTGSMFSNPDAPFALGDIDWTLAPKIVADARAALAMPDGRITAINVNKPTDGVGLPAPLWTVHIEENGERGTYIADMKGIASTVELPKSRRQPTAWLDSAVMARTFGRIASEFGPDSRLVTVFIEGDGGRITADDPRKPGERIEVLLREDGLKRWSKPMFESGKSFAASELQAFTAEAIAALLERSMKALDMPDATLRHVTIGRDVLGISRLDRVTVATLFQTPRGRQGRVVQALDGTIVEVYKP